MPFPTLDQLEQQARDDIHAAERAAAEQPQAVYAQVIATTAVARALLALGERVAQLNDSLPLAGRGH
jgi:hypothetical protein